MLLVTTTRCLSPPERLRASSVRLRACSNVASASAAVDASASAAAAASTSAAADAAAAAVSAWMPFVLLARQCCGDARFL